MRAGNTKERPVTAMPDVLGRIKVRYEQGVVCGSAVEYDVASSRGHQENFSLLRSYHAAISGRSFGATGEATVPSLASDCDFGWTFRY